MNTIQPVVGLYIRAEASIAGVKLGLLPRGTKILIKNRKPNNWAQVDRILSGEIVGVRAGEPADPKANQGWVFLDKMKPGPKKPLELDKVVVPTKPVPVRAGEMIGHMGEYQQYVDSQPFAKRGWRPLLHIEVFASPDLSDFVTKSRKYASLLPPGTGSLFVVPKGTRLKLPTLSDGQVAPTEQLMTCKNEATGPWIKVQRSRLEIIHREKLGPYSTSSKAYANAKDAEWTGVFVGPSDTERTTSTAEAQKKNYQRREMKRAEGQAFWILRNDYANRPSAPIKTWKNHPLSLASPDGEIVGFTRVIKRAELEKTAAEQRAHDAEGKSWWEVAVRGQAQGAEIRGWVCEEGMAGVSWQSPWAWPGFNIAEEGDIRPVDLMASWLTKMGVSRAEEYRDHKMRADKVDRSELLKQIYLQLDTNNDGHLTKQELLAAAKQPLLAEALSRLIVRYESEWGGDDAKWNELDPLMLDGTPEWAAEKLRIMKLRWWSEVAPRVPGFPKSPEVFHIHPIGLLNNFFSPLPAANKAVTGAKTAQPSDRKSGAHWHSYFPQSADIADLKEPFRSNVSSFIAALEAAGVKLDINTTLRPPQRSYLMYYAREIARGNMAPKDVPAFEPQNGDQPVDIDWEHRDASGKPDPDAAKKGAQALDAKYRAAGAIGKPYKSNHNDGEAIDVSFRPAWAIGKSVVKKTGEKIEVTSKQDLIDIGASYSVFHWNYAGAKAKVDDPHWSRTGK